MSHFELELGFGSSGSLFGFRSLSWMSANKFETHTHRQTVKNCRALRNKRSQTRDSSSFVPNNKPDDDADHQELPNEKRSQSRANPRLDRKPTRTLSRAARAEHRKPTKRCPFPAKSWASSGPQKKGNTCACSMRGSSGPKQAKAPPKPETSGWPRTHWPAKRLDGLETRNSQCCSRQHIEHTNWLWIRQPEMIRHLTWSLVEWRAIQFNNSRLESSRAS